MESVEYAINDEAAGCINTPAASNRSPIKGGSRMADSTDISKAKPCQICGEYFFKKAYNSATQWTKRRFCSMKCRGVWQSKDRMSPLSDRFWGKVTKRKVGCWSWTGTVDQHGYGKITAGARGAGHIKAHRLSWELHFGHIPSGLNVLHACDNPNCVNPGHLMIGTQEANIVDMGRKGRVHENSIANLRSQQNGR